MTERSSRHISHGPLTAFQALFADMWGVNKIGLPVHAYGIFKIMRMLAAIQCQTHPKPRGGGITSEQKATLEMSTSTTTTTSEYYAGSLS